MSEPLWMGSLGSENLDAKCGLWLSGRLSAELGSPAACRKID